MVGDCGYFRAIAFVMALEKKARLFLARTFMCTGFNFVGTNVMLGGWNINACRCGEYETV